MAAKDGASSGLTKVPIPHNLGGDKAKKEQVAKLPEVTVKEVEALLTFFYDGYVC